MSNPSQKETNDVLCVILHFGETEDTIECLASLQAGIPIDIVVVDNDPRQNFALSPEWEHYALVVKSGGAMGFAEANNFGVERARQPHHQFVFVLNNDTVVRSDAVGLLRAAIAESGAGMAGPVMPYYDDPGRVWAAGGRVSCFFVTIDGIRRWPSSKLSSVDYLPGAAFMAQIDLWDEIGGLRVQYFLGFEEAEFAMEVRKRRFGVVVHRDAVVLHKVGMSSDRQPMYFYNTVRNRIVFGRYCLRSSFGAFWGGISGLLRSYSLERLALWFQAIRDYMQGKRLDQQSLFRVRDRFNR